VGFISNREVLDLLLEEQSNQNAAMQKLRAGRKALEQASSAAKPRKSLPAWDEVKETSRLILPENVRSVQLQTIEFLSDNELSTRRQSSEGVGELTRALGQIEPSLTKLEKLQLVNTAPSNLPELYITVDNLESRLDSDRQEEILELIKIHSSSTNRLDQLRIDRVAQTEAQERHLRTDAARREARANLRDQEIQEDLMEDEDFEEDLFVSGAHQREEGTGLELDEVES